MTELSELLPVPKNSAVIKTPKTQELAPLHVKDEEASSHVQGVAANSLIIPFDPEVMKGQEAQILAHIGQPQGRLIQATLPEATPIAERLKSRAPGRLPFFPLPSPEVIAAQVEELRQSIKQALNSLNRPTNTGNNSSVKYVQYQDQGQKQRIIRVAERQVDPLEPPRFKHKKAPAPPPSPPAPVLHSPPRKAPIELERAWKVPPCVSSWKNPKGYTIPLDKRMINDPKDALPQQVSEGFAQVSQALYVAEKAAKEHLKAKDDLNRYQLQSQLKSVLHRSREDDVDEDEDEDIRNLSKGHLTSGLLEDDGSAAVMYDKPLFAGDNRNRGLAAFHKVTLDEDIHGRQQADLVQLLKRAQSVGSRRRPDKHLLKTEAYDVNRLLSNDDAVRLSEPVPMTPDIPSFALHSNDKEEQMESQTKPQYDTEDIFGLDDLLQEAKKASMSSNNKSKRSRR